ncbi:MAG: hypothetical protein D6778_03120 [Nitrospirae bacterium]|nr:MAG: hypothetical protein D6778_03120 [Nitrospirota bacterium]
MKKKGLFTLLILFFSISFYLLGSYRVSIPYADRKAEEYFSQTSKMALVGYATTRLLNAAVSVAKESSFQVGLGAEINIAAGQVLDPIDDLTEKLSNIFLLVIVSLGIQKLAMTVGQIFTFKAAGLFLVLLLPAIWIERGFFFNLAGLALKAVIVLMALRFFLPFSAMVNDLVYAQVIEPEAQKAKAKLSSYVEVTEDNVEDEAVFQQGEELSWWESLKEKVLSLGKSIQIKTAQALKIAKNVLSNPDDVIGAMVNLSILYIAIFVIQCLLIPLLMLWIAVKFLDVLFRTRFEDRLIGSFSSG